jgi:hypothetical protein
MIKYRSFKSNINKYLKQYYSPIIHAVYNKDYSPSVPKERGNVPDQKMPLGAKSKEQSGQIREFHAFYIYLFSSYKINFTFFENIHRKASGESE